MHDQSVIALEVDQQVLGSAPQLFDPAATDHATQPSAVHGLAQGRVADPYTDDPLAHQERLEAAAQDFDLGQLGHPSRLSRSGPERPPDDLLTNLSK
jgi:hypothetical protein